MDPICKLANACVEGNTEVMNKMLTVLNLTLTQEDAKL